MTSIEADRSITPVYDPEPSRLPGMNGPRILGYVTTPEEQRVKLIDITKQATIHADYKAQVEDNPDSENRHLALVCLIHQAISSERRWELHLYRRYASDPDFKRASDTSIFRILSSQGIGSQLGRGAT